MTGTFNFKKFTGENLENVEQYVREYCKEHSNIDVMVGTDSQGRGAKTIFSTIVAPLHITYTKSAMTQRALNILKSPYFSINFNVFSKNPNCSPSNAIIVYYLIKLQQI